jgi:hypothetical protein
MSTQKIKLTAFFLAFALSFAAVGVPARASAADQNLSGSPLLYGPYVTAVSPSGAIVLWLSPPGVDGACRFLDDSSASKVELLTAPVPGSATVRHTAVVTGLKADQLHRYVVSAGRDQAEGSFRTPPPSGARRPFTFAVTGDTQGNPLRIRAILDAISKEAPAFLIHSGDLCDDGQNWSLWQNQFFGPARDLLRQTPIWPTRGNHEHGAEPFATMFGLPAARDWYSFNYDNLHVVALDQWDVAGDGPMEPQRLAEMAQWLDQDLAAAQARGDWILINGHQPMFNVAGHGSTWGHEQIMPILFQHGVDIYTSGHSHLYERFLPIGPPGAKPILFLVAGGGGGPNYPAVPSPVLVKNYAATHYCLYHVDGDRLELTVKAADGLVVDQVVLTRSNGVLPQRLLDTAISPEEAMRLLKVYKIQTIDFPTRPQGGETITAMLQPRFPPDSRVTISSDPNCPWALEVVSFQGSGPVALKVTPPLGVRLGQYQNFSPPLTVAVSFQYEGRTYSCPSILLNLTAESQNRLAPVVVPAAKAGSLNKSAAPVK